MMNENGSANTFASHQELHASSARPTADEIGRIEYVGCRVQAELCRLIHCLPEYARSVRSMARFLEVDRNVAQRVISAAQPGLRGLDVVLRLPGMSGLNGLCRAAAAKRMPEEVVRSVTAAVSQLSESIEQFGGSLARAKTLIGVAVVSGRTAADRSELDVRRFMHDDAIRLLDQGMSVRSLITAVGPREADPETVEQAWVTSMVGLRVGNSPTPIPLAIGTTDRAGPAGGEPAVFRPLSGREDGRQRPVTTVESLSSRPLPVVTTRGPRGAVVAAIDPVRAASAQPLTVSVATRISHFENPYLRQPKVFHTSALIMTPAKRLVFDVYLHRSLAPPCIPSVGAFHYAMSFSDDIEENWPFRVPGVYSLRALGSNGLDQAASEAWDKHAEAAEFLFSSTGWDPRQYIGHRLDCAFPIWGLNYCMWFDARGTDRRV